MSTAQRAESSSTDVVLSGSAAVGILPPYMQRALEMRKLQNQVAGQLASLNWGKQLDLPTRRAIADWGQQFRVDVTTEIHVLGGNVYLNAAFYLRQLSEMISAGLVAYALADHVENDLRLARIGPDGEGEMTRRLRERIKHAIPDEAKSAVVFRVKLRTMEQEIVGVKWCGGGTRKNDPVGDAMPVETSESRAARRAMRLLKSHVPPVKATELEMIERSAELLSERVDHARHEVKAQTAAIETRHPRQLMPSVDAEEPYNLDASGGEQVRDVPATPAPARTAAQRARAEEAARSADPYEGEKKSENANAPAASQVRLPFTINDALKGTIIANVSTKDLTDAVRKARAEGDREAFVEAASEELERRELAGDEAEVSA